ncbi:MAG: L-erythro-3,5-diaminohexanoate dehydrogenase [Vulcanimicrobiaceae bacterium]
MKTIFAGSPHPLGIHRVLEPIGAMPQAAWKLDAEPICAENEILCDVEVLNIDSASFTQMRDVCENDPARIGEHIAATVRQRGKQHNAVTGSGGMFIGRVAEIGSRLRDRLALQVGDRIASLVSLTLTPLRIDAVERVDVATGRVWVRGQAVLFETGLWAQLPADIDENVALAVLDVAGAPAQTQRLCKPGQTVVVIGAAGKSGLLTCAHAKARVGATGRVIGIAHDASTSGAQLLRDAQLVDALVSADARDALAVAQAVETLAPQLADVTINCVNVPGTELSSILCTKDEGIVYFFSMATSFTAAALGAEGVGRDVTMIVGNGYCKNHAQIALQTLRDHPQLRAYFESKYATPV